MRFLADTLIPAVICSCMRLQKERHEAAPAIAAVTVVPVMEIEARVITVAEATEPFRAFDPFLALAPDARGGG